MKIAVSASGNTLDVPVDPRFGRCACFILIDTETMAFEACPNDNVDVTGGAGIQSAAFVISKGAKAVLTGRCGPNAMKVFQAEGIDVIQGMGDTVKTAVEGFKKGVFTPSTTAMAQEKDGLRNRPAPGLGRGMGFGRGMGGRRGMGLGRGIRVGRGMGPVNR